MPLSVYGLMCPVCLTSLHHLVGEQDPLGDKDQPSERSRADEGGQLPLISSFSHPLESHRFRRLLSSLLVLDVLRKARTLSDNDHSNESLEAYPQRELTEILGGMARYYGCGEIALYLSEEADEIKVLGDWQNPRVLIPQSLSVLTSEQELAFLVIAALYPLFAGTLALVRLGCPSYEGKRRFDSLARSRPLFCRQICCFVLSITSPVAQSPIEVPHQKR